MKRRATGGGLAEWFGLAWGFCPSVSSVRLCGGFLFCLFRCCGGRGRGRRPRCLEKDRARRRLSARRGSQNDHPDDERRRVAHLGQALRLCKGARRLWRCAKPKASRSKWELLIQASCWATTSFSYRITSGDGHPVFGAVQFRMLGGKDRASSGGVAEIR